MVAFGQEFGLVIVSWLGATLIAVIHDMRLDALLHPACRVPRVTPFMALVFAVIGAFIAINVFLVPDDGQKRVLVTWPIRISARTSRRPGLTAIGFTRTVEFEWSSF